MKFTVAKVYLNYLGDTLFLPSLSQSWKNYLMSNLVALQKNLAYNLLILEFLFDLFSYDSISFSDEYSSVVVISGHLLDWFRGD